MDKVWRILGWLASLLRCQLLPWIRSIHLEDVSATLTLVGAYGTWVAPPELRYLATASSLAGLVDLALRRWRNRRR